MTPALQRQFGGQFCCLASRRKPSMDQNLTIFLAPICIIGGGGLIAFGALTLFGLDLLFKTKTQAILGICVGVVLIGALEIRFYASGASFFENQKVVVNYCHVVAEKENPGQQGTKSDALNKSIAACLSKEGYEWSPEHRHCKEAPLAMNEYCYLPTEFFSRLITKMQLVFE
jgi:hypothetical protein